MPGGLKKKKGKGRQKGTQPRQWQGKPDTVMLSLSQDTWEFDEQNSLILLHPSKSATVPWRMMGRDSKLLANEANEQSAPLPQES